MKVDEPTIQDFTLSKHDHLNDAGGGTLSGVGQSGYSGWSGYSGHSGYSGVGTSGYSGASGYSGKSGYSGIGTSGYSGIGTSGYSGISGYSGKSGYSGIGTSGYSGASGYSGLVTLTETMASDTTAIGIIESKTAGENVVFGDIVYFKSDGKAWKANAATAGLFPAQAMAIATISANNPGNFLLYGTARKDAWNWTIGGILYLDSSAGGMTQSQPSTVDYCIQVLGVCHPNADTILFNPDQSYITHT